jgi:PAS domain S-box-containing protein
MNEAETAARRSFGEQSARDELWRLFDDNRAAIAVEARGLSCSRPAFAAAFDADGEALRAHWDSFIDAFGRFDAAEWPARATAIAASHARFAAAGVSLEDWVYACSLVQARLLPRVVAAFAGDGERLTAALVAQNESSARVLEVLARAAREVHERALHELAKGEAQAKVRFESLAESGMLGVLVCDYQGNIVEANDGFLETFGYSRQDLISGQVQWLTMTPPEWRHLDEDAIEQLRQSGKTRPWEKEYFHKNGSRVPVLVGVATLSEAQTIAFVLDISERQRLEAIRARSIELEMQNRRIQEASRLKSEFLANMSHELRTPLNSIIGFTELLRDREVDPDSPHYIEFLDDILKSGRHLHQLINDVLDLAKVEAGKLELRPETVDVAQLVAEVSAVLRGVAAAKTIRIEAVIDAEVQKATLDPARFKQILYNYLSNALKFTPEGGTVTVSARPEADLLCLTVEDTGIGIAPADIGRLFVDFQQLEEGATKKHSGTGLGLALTKRLVEAQGGSVGVKSTLGKGSQFFAMLPLHAPTSGITSKDGAPGEYGISDGAASVLVIEDDARDRALLIQTLVRAGYGVEAVATGRQGVLSCAERVFDAITLDLLLPDMTGLDVLHRIRTEGKNKQTPVVVVSVVAERNMMAGFSVQDYLNKPVNGRALLEAFEQAHVPPRRGGRILIVDDDPAAQRLMAATLEELGYEIQASLGAEDALTFSAGEQPIAVVLDLVMPGVDGLEFLARFREMPGNHAVPVIIWTMKDLSAADHQGLRKLAQGIVEKNNWRPSTFVDEVRKLIGQVGTGVSEVA